MMTKLWMLILVKSENATKNNVEVEELFEDDKS